MVGDRMLTLLIVVSNGDWSTINKYTPKSSIELENILLKVYG